MESKEFERILSLAQKPARYTGGELNSVVRNWNEYPVRFAFCFPDIYEIGMSHLGMKILYSLINSTDYSLCERVFAPASDVERLLRDGGHKLFSLETHTDVCDFDFVGFSLQYELSYTNVLNMLDLSGIPLFSKDRTELSPLVVAGGPCTCNAEPVADFFDLVLPGEGEEVMLELLELYREYKKKGSDKHEFLLAASKLEGVYVPSFYNIKYKNDGTIESISPTNGAPDKVKKRIVSDLNKVFYPDSFVVPFIEIVHDRAVHEIFRGCIRGCRFCQAGFIYRPYREKSIDTISRQSKELCSNTGYDELSLCSLSSSDYSQISKLLEELLSWTEDGKINIALPSQRIDSFSAELTEKLASVRRAGLTFAPEAGTQRLRDVINKNITHDEIILTSRRAFSGGWTGVKLYFMLGLPTETDEDVEGIALLSQEVVEEYYSNPDKPKGKGVTVSVSASSFIPKPFTPFQWVAQDTREEFARKQKLLTSSVKTRKISLKMNNTSMSFLEAVLARGDRRLSALLAEAWRLGCSFDSWDDSFDFEKWQQAAINTGTSFEFYANRQRDFDEILPWDILDYGVNKDFLISEYNAACSGKTTPNCREKCAGCGANTLNGGKCDARS